MKRVVLHVFMPLLIGGIIYFFFKEHNLVIYNWLESAGMRDMSEQLRGLRTGINVPYWVSMHLADGLWAYSITASMLIFSESFGWAVAIQLFIALVSGVSYEIAQYLNIMSGVFDWIDVAYSLGFSFLAFWLLVKPSFFRKTINEKPIL